MQNPFAITGVFVARKRKIVKAFHGFIAQQFYQQSANRKA